MEPANEGGGDTVVTDKELFDQASADVTPDPVAKAEPEAAPEPQEKGERTRDELGRFAKGETPKPAQVQAPKVEAAKPQPAEQDHRVPLRELLDEREKRQQIAQQLAQLQAWQQQALQWQAQQARRAQNPQEPPNIFDNPDQYLHQRFVQPLQQWGQQGMMKVKDDMSRTMAEMQPGGAEAVSEALKAMEAVRYTPEGTFAYQQIMNSGHPYGALVKWHQEAKMRQEIGSDPKAYRQKVIDEAMKDPEIQAKFVELIRGQQKGSGRPPVVSLPPSLSSQPGASGNTEQAGDMSDSSIYNMTR